MRICSVCRHPKRGQIETAIARGLPLRDIAGQFGGSKSAIDRHRRLCIASLLANRIAANDQARAISIDSELRRSSEMLNKMLAACSERLTDPDNPNRYTLAPRADEVQVTYREKDPQTGRVLCKKDSLEVLLAKTGVDIERCREKSIDPAQLLLRTLDQMTKHIDLRAKLEGAYNRSEPDGPRVIQLAWIQAILVQNGYLPTR